MKKTLLLSSTLGALACLSQSALAQTAATAPAPAPQATTVAATTPAPAPDGETTDPAPDATDPTEVAPATEPAAPPPPVTEPAPEAALLTAPVAAEPAPPPIEVKPLPYMQRYLPEKNTWELGLFGGMMFPSSEHQLFDPALGTGAQRPFDTAGEIGLRVGYFPLAFLGIEAEAAAMPASVQLEPGDTADGSGGLWALRGQLVGQLPMWSVTPFVVVGFGALGASSDAMGNDVDDAFHFGAGVKVPIDGHLMARLDIRDTITRQVGTSAGTGTHSPEVLLGLSFILGRKRPDADRDSYLDYEDQCPTKKGEGDDCPPPDADADGVIDEKDECPADVGIAPTGCPDQDGDGFLDKADPCPTLAGPPPTGCPEKECPVADTDGDGITDAADQCPSEAAATLNGCAPKDTDGDLVPDELDQCPNEAETKDGVTDEDGCPEAAAPAATTPAAATAKPPTAKPPTTKPPTAKPTP